MLSWALFGFLGRLKEGIRTVHRPQPNSPVFSPVRYWAVIFKPTGSLMKSPVSKETLVRAGDPS